MLKGAFPGPRPSSGEGRGAVALILGIDPGMGTTGFGLIESDPNGSLRYCESGVLRPRGTSVPPRLQQIFRGLKNLMETSRPQFIAVERPFFGKNAKSAMLLGQARGAALLAAALTTGPCPALAKGRGQPIRQLLGDVGDGDAQPFDRGLRLGQSGTGVGGQCRGQERCPHLSGNLALFVHCFLSSFWTSTFILQISQ